MARAWRTGHHGGGAQSAKQGRKAEAGPGSHDSEDDAAQEAADREQREEEGGPEFAGRIVA